VVQTKSPLDELIVQDGKRWRDRPRDYCPAAQPAAGPARSATTFNHVSQPTDIVNPSQEPLKKGGGFQVALRKSWLRSIASTFSIFVLLTLGTLSQHRKPLFPPVDKSYVQNTISCTSRSNPTYRSPKFRSPTSWDSDRENIVWNQLSR
jgi:hypothetical protein